MVKDYLIQPNVSNKTLITNAGLKYKTNFIGKIGIMMLSCGTGAWRVRESMNSIAKVLNIRCFADIGLVSINYTCYEKCNSCSQTLTLSETGINMVKLHDLEDFVNFFQLHGTDLTVAEVCSLLKKINRSSNNYSKFTLSLAAGLACSAFVFLLGGGIIEMFCSLIAATLGNYIRQIIGKHNLISLLGIISSVATACISYAIVFYLLEISFHLSIQHEAGYIGAMLFVVPGFPFITSGLDIAKLDMHSGLERAAYALMVISIASLVAWIIAFYINLKPSNFTSLNLTPFITFILRIPASFIGVFGFSLMFNSTPKMAFLASIVGAFANTFRLELIDFTSMPPAAASFVGALCAGILASIIQLKNGDPRISITVPSIVIMVPGLYMYRAIYDIGNLSLISGISWLVKSIMIIIFLQLGLVVARAISDYKWRHTIS